MWGDNCNCSHLTEVFPWPWIQIPFIPPFASCSSFLILDILFSLVLGISSQEANVHVHSFIKGGTISVVWLQRGTGTFQASRCYYFPLSLRHWALRVTCLLKLSLSLLKCTMHIISLFLLDPFRSFSCLHVFLFIRAISARLNPSHNHIQSILL